MAFDKYNDDDENDNDALVKQLGDDKPGVSTTQPVTTAPFATTEAADQSQATPTTDTPVSAAYDPSKVTASVFQGFTPKHAMEGFDFNREQNTGKSAKDAFAYLSQQAPPPPIQDKAALGAWFKQYIEPGMNALGHQVTNVEGDKFGFKNWQGEFNVDYGRGAGAEGGALAWQVDDPSAVLSNAAYVPRSTAAETAGAAATGGDDEVTSAQDQLQAEIDAIIRGDASPLDQDALLAQLQG